MFVWEWIAHRLRSEGWAVNYAEVREADGPAYVVQIRRGVQSWRASGPTLTDAFAAAARRARQSQPQAQGAASPPRPHFAATAAVAR